ncbi:MAG: hypothetical protein Kow0056_14940 [Coriobacteriia bacterium]
MAAEVSTALEEHVKRRLEDTFGKAVAMLILASATSAAKVPTADLTAGEYRRLVDAICCDQRVLDMWGEDGAESARQEWLALV